MSGIRRLASAPDHAPLAAFLGLFLLTLTGGGCDGGPVRPGAEERPGADSTAEGSEVGSWDVELTDLGTLGGRSSSALAVDGRGHAVGKSAPAGHMPEHLFLWDGEAMRDLGSLGGGHAAATDLAEDGTVVGWSERADPPMIHRAVARIDGALVELGTLGGMRSRALAVNGRGQIVGESDAPDGLRAFLWENGAMRSLGTLGGGSSRATDINAHGQVVGGSETAAGEHHAFLWEDGRMLDLGTLGGDESLALGVSDAGHVVGWSRTAGGEVHPFLWRDGEMRDLAPVAGAGFVPHAANRRGWVAGAVEPSGEGGPRAYLLIGEERIELPTLGGDDGRAYDVSDEGRVAGFTRDGSGDARAVIWTVR